MPSAPSVRLRKDRWPGRPGDAGQRLRAGAERGDAEALHVRCVLVERRDPLAEREPTEQIVGCALPIGGARRRGTDVLSVAGKKCKRKSDL